MTQLTTPQHDALTRLADQLIDQHNAQIIVPASSTSPGHWFGGGNVVRDPEGRIWLCGRFRNDGDSRTGIALGDRGVACVIYVSEDNGRTFQEAQRFTKEQLSLDGQVLSIEGSALHIDHDGDWQLFVSVEKDIRYPEEYAQYQKPGTGVWQIDAMRGPDPTKIDTGTLEPVLVSDGAPERLHVKDPFIIDDGQQFRLGFCTHPISWSASMTGVATRASRDAELNVLTWDLASRGSLWDVAATRVTAHLPIPQVGELADLPPMSLYFYDGAECLRSHDENRNAFSRPRGYSCEELGGAFYGVDAEFPALHRLSRVQPFFVSPWGTGCSRYVDVLTSEDGVTAYWQQSQADGSQPLVAHHLPMSEVHRALGA